MKTRKFYQIPRLPKDISETEYFGNQNSARMALAEWRYKWEGKPGFTVHYIDSDTFKVEDHNWAGTTSKMNIITHTMNEGVAFK